VGDHDWTGSKDSSAKLAAILPQAKVVVIHHAGHFSNLENPLEFNHAITTFLAANAAK
jgi:pimeloyl-ACP methyl ester carboxylesterase